MQLVSGLKTHIEEQKKGGGGAIWQQPAFCRLLSFHSIWQTGRKVQTVVEQGSCPINHPYLYPRLQDVCFLLAVTLLLL